MKNNFLLSIGQKKLSNLKGRGRRIAALSTMTVLLTGIIALASIPGANGVINGCYNRNGDSSLRVIDSTAQCRANEIALNFNQTGPRGLQGLQGLQGTQGADGATGPAGANGLSEAYFNRNVARIDLTQSFTPILTKNVPAGSYVINAKVGILNASRNLELLTECKLNTGDRSAVRIAPQTSNTISLQDDILLVLQDVVTFDAPATIILGCNSFSLGGSFINGSATANNIALTAIKVDAVH